MLETSAECVFLGPSHRSGTGLPREQFEGGLPSNSDANYTQATLQDALLKGLREWQRGSPRGPTGGFGDGRAHVTRAVVRE